ncbi:MAG: hypothetical protein HOL01_12555 [Planctomycetaceae bacterium]|jgi:hypothetical protein|nr:hypothetical protein [Planctomycetaceae bacterium]MBT6483077.1 hypothetical protein [Planctomycetaceae bacterium]MBT6495374.1 hypothetical protein [Planctomycetaceae bacterium]
MYSRQWAFCIVCGLTVMTAIGCYSHYPSSVYGPGGYPGSYAVPPGAGYPQGGSYTLPQNAPLQGSGASVTPNGSFQSPSANGSTSRWQSSGSGGDAPAYDSAKNPAPTGGNTNPVPNYNDPNAGNGAPADSFGAPDEFRDTETFDADPPVNNGGQEPKGSFDLDDNPSPFKDGAASISNESVPFDENAPFVTPKTPLTPVASIRNVSDSSETVAAASSPYKHDRENFQWLRGVVDYDSEARSWNIIYNVEPDQQDQFGGSIVLAGADEFETLQNDDVILVEGGVDAKQLDALGKPMFRVDRLVRLEPVH